MVMTTQAEELRQSTLNAVKAYVAKALTEMGKALAKALAPRDRRLEVLEKALAETRAELTETKEYAKNLRHRGVWQRAEQYQKGNRVTFNGSQWEALADSPGKPGADDRWQLTAKGYER